MLEHILSQRGISVSQFQCTNSIGNSFSGCIQCISSCRTSKSSHTSSNSISQIIKTFSSFTNRFLFFTLVNCLPQSILGNRKRIAGLHNLNGSNCSSHSATCPTGGHLNTLKADKIARCSTIEVFQVTDFNSKLSIFSYCRLNFVNGSFVNRTITHQTNSSTRSAFNAKL